MTINVQQVPTSRTPFHYIFAGGSILEMFSLDILPEGIKIERISAPVSISCYLSYEQFEDWFNRLKTALAAKEDTVIESDKDAEGNWLRFFVAHPDRPYNSLQIGSTAVITGRMKWLAPLMEVMHMASMFPSFVAYRTSYLAEKIDFYEERYGTIEDLSCPRCNNPYELDGDDKCMYCRECPVCTAAVYDHTCQVCNHHLGEWE